MGSVDIFKYFLFFLLLTVVNPTIWHNIPFYNNNNNNNNI